MQKAKQIFFKFSEYYLLVLVILSGYNPPFTFNPICLGLAAMLILQIVFKNQVFGNIIGFIFMLINLYMLGALISELSEFTEFNNRAMQMLFVGLSIWILNMLASVAIIYKYSKTDIGVNPQEEYYESGLTNG